MFGALRLFLAYLVVLSHLVGSDYILHFGFYAVRGFFVLSGFIITAALNDVYRFDGTRFWTNRLLRLLPPYYTVCALTLIAVMALPEQAGEFLGTWKHDPRTSDLLMNFLVLPMQFTGTSFRIFPPYWSVAVEIVMYALLWLLIARRETFAAIALGAGIVYHLASIDVGWSWTARYFTAPSALLSFSIGALIYFLRKRGVLEVGPGVTCFALVAWLANMMAGGSIFPDSYIFGAGYYIGAFYFALAVAGLAGQKYAAPWAARDQLLGELAYPLFLLQWLVGFLFAVTFFPGVWRGWELTLAATPVMLMAAYGLARLHTTIVEPMRRRVRSGAGLGAGELAELAAGPPEQFSEVPVTARS